MRISESLDQYLIQLQGDGRAKPTVDQARRHIRLLITSVGDIEIADVRHETIAAFLASDVVRTRAGGGARKPTSANALRSSIRCFFGYCHMAGLAPTNAARMVRRARCSPPRPKGMSEPDIAKLIAALATARTRAERRDQVLFTLMLRTGLRVGSTVGLDIADVDLAGGELRLRVMKNADEDMIFLPADVIEPLRAYIGTRKSGPLFPGINGGRLAPRQIARRLQEWGTRAGIERRLHPHMTRHSFAMAAYGRTGDLLVVSRMLCHRSIASTSVYARPDAARVRAAMAAV